MGSGGGTAGTGTITLSMLARAYLAVIRRQAMERVEKGATTATMKN